MRTELMRAASYLLPDPGGEVVRDLLGEVERLTESSRALRQALEAVEWHGQWGSCGLCFESEADGHTHDCKIAAALKLAREE